MPHSRGNPRRHPWALVVGIGISAAVHAFVIFELAVPLPALPESSLVAMNTDEPDALQPIELLPPLEPVVTPAEAEATSAPAPSAARSTVIADAGDPMFEAMKADSVVLVLPVLGNVEPVALATPEPVAEPAESDIPVYVPGSIGKAKEAWAPDGAGEARTSGIGFFDAIRVGRPPHCPMPGRGRGRGRIDF